MLEQAFLGEHDFYEVMGLEPGATQVEVDDAFKQLSGDLNLRHPEESERIRAAESMLRLTQAYEALSDPMLRARYDLQMLGRRNQPVKDQVDILFKEGIRAWRKRETDLALRYLKEVTHLYPHRPLYRVHLAIAYAEKDWFTFTEAELETALRLDPDYAFAKETIAKLLFKLPDRRNSWYQNTLNRQVAILAAVFVGMGVLLASGLPQSLATQLMARMSGASEAIQTQDSELPADMLQELEKQQNTAEQAIAIPEFAADYRPDGKVFDYGSLEAQEKVYYPDQKVVVVTYKDGSILTYRPQELKGWKKNAAGVPIMITANNEMIPSPATLPLKLPGNVTAKLDDPAFPTSFFPEYGVSSAASTEAPPASSNPVAPASAAPAGNQPPPAPTAAPTQAPITPPAQAPANQGALYNPYGGGR
ncbi:MAG: J domain-containing protein [Candidatus Sericytochromatia bacterium]